jgi:deoxyribonuclease-4
MHLNDSKKELATRVHRHDNIRKGFIVEGLFKSLINDPRIDDIPLILETPEDSLWAEEIKMLYGMVEQEIRVRR